MKLSGALVVLCLVIAMPAWAFKPPVDPQDLWFEAVELRPGVTADVHVRLFQNDRSCFGSAFAIHGVAHTAATWKPFAHAAFAAKFLPLPPCRVAAVDLPGHGLSGLPSGILFGDLSLYDYTSAVIGALEGLAEHGIRVNTIIGHSMGGLLVQTVQERLLSQGSSLRDAFGLRRALLLASSLPAAVSGDVPGVPDLTPFIVTDPSLGRILVLPDFLWPLAFFFNTAGLPAQGTPTPAEVGSLGYNSIESVRALMEVLERLAQVRAEAFCHTGTRLIQVMLGSDPFGNPTVQQGLFDHLTCEPSLARQVVVTGPNAVHDAHVAVPLEVLQALVAPPWP